MARIVKRILRCAQDDNCRKEPQRGDLGATVWDSRTTSYLPRHLPSPLSPFALHALQRADAVIAAPFVGITTDGHALPGLFSLQPTGVSTRPLKEAAEAFLASLDQQRRKDASFALDDGAWLRWNNTHPFLMRHGILLEDLDAGQRESALDLIRTSLSSRGFGTARDIMRLNETIGELSGHWDQYGEWVYWLSIFGTPSMEQPWGWQIDGHHLNVNCLVIGDQVVMTPAFFGSEPTWATTGKYAGTRVFDAEEQAGLAFMRGLSAAQRSVAVLSASPCSTRRGIACRGAHRTTTMVLRTTAVRAPTS